MRQRNGLRQLSAERIGHEMRRLLRAPLAAYSLKMMNDCGLWEIATGGLARIEDYEALRQLDEVAPETREPELGLVVLAGFVREDLERICDRLRLSNAERKRMQTAWAAKKKLQNLQYFPDAPALLYEFGKKGAIDGLLAVWSVRIARDLEDRVAFSNMLAAIRQQMVPEFPLKGADLIASGHLPGRMLGEELKRLESEWIQSGFTLTRRQLLEGSSAKS